MSNIYFDTKTVILILNLDICIFKQLRYYLGQNLPTMCNDTFCSMATILVKKKMANKGLDSVLDISIHLNNDRDLNGRYLTLYML